MLMPWFYRCVSTNKHCDTWKEKSIPFCMENVSSALSGLHRVVRRTRDSVQSLSHVRLFATPWIAALQASLSITNSQSLLKLMPIESVMPSSHLILCRPLLLLPPVPPSIRVFSNESTLRMRWPKYWRFSFSISPSNEHTRLGAAKLSPATLYVPGQAAHQLNLSVLSAVQGW